MRYFLILIFTISLFSQETEEVKKYSEVKESKNETQPDSKNQAERRIAKKNQVQVNYEDSLGTKYGIGYYYILNKYFSIGSNYQKYLFNNQDLFANFDLSSQRQVLLKFESVQRNYDQDYFNILGRVFPFNSFPLYLSVGIERAFKSISETTIPVLLLNRGNLVPFTFLGSNEVTLKPQNLFHNSFGFQWNFLNGLVLNIESVQAKAFERELSFKTIIYPSTTVDGYLSLYLQNYAFSHKNLNNDYTLIKFSFGYAF